MTAWYNDNDPYVAQWVGNLIAAGHLPKGTVDDRSILEIEPDDLRSFRQCHFFAGIGGWPLALALADWPDDREVWTASCPCQPLSSAGQRKGHADERHLWPAFYRLVAERRPATIFGEQVASKDGREWLAGIRADLGHLGYAVGAADLPAASVGATHIRQRLFWVANASSTEQRRRPANGRESNGLVHASERGATGGLGDADPTRSQGCSEFAGERADQRSARATGEPFWSDAIWLACLDGKARRVEPGVFPLAHGVSSRVGRLRAYGNAIVPQVAAEFVTAFLEGEEMTRRQ
jgi:DNA (cytosine-5)-methyltransferase 1